VGKRQLRLASLLRTISIRLYLTIIVQSALLALAFNGDATATQSPPAVPNDWINVEIGSAFSLMAPQGSVAHQGEGTDSLIGTIEVNGIKLSFDYGFYSNPLTNNGSYQNYITEDVLIDGVSARIVTGYTTRNSPSAPYFIGIHFPKIKNTVIGSTRLTIYTQLKSKENHTMIGQIFRTLQLKERE